MYIRVQLVWNCGFRIEKKVYTTFHNSCFKEYLFKTIAYIYIDTEEDKTI